MVPLLPFVAGLLAGAATVKLLRRESTRARLAQAQEKLRQATVSGLSVVEHSSAAMRDKLAAAPQPAAKAAKGVKTTRPRKAATKPARTAKAKAKGDVVT